MTQCWFLLETKKVVTVQNILLRTLKVSFSRLKIAVIHNSSVIDRHFLSPESIFHEKHHITSVHKQSFCENTDPGLELLWAQFPCSVQMAVCICTAEAQCIGRYDSRQTWAAVPRPHPGCWRVASDTKTNCFSLMCGIQQRNHLWQSTYNSTEIRTFPVFKKFP